MSIKKYIESNKARFIEELFSLIRIPSLSARHDADRRQPGRVWGKDGFS